MSHATPYTAEAVSGPDGLSDIRIHINGKTWHLWGRKGDENERELTDAVPDNVLPVLMGAGLGSGLEELIQRGIPVAVVDKETTISNVSGVRKRYEDHTNIIWIEADSPEEALSQLTDWQREHQGTPFHPVPFPLYLRLDRAYYGVLHETLKANANTDFWSQARYSKFQSQNPKVLFFDSKYFLCNEILAALKQLGIEHQTITLDGQERGSQDFIETLLRTVIDFRPDFILTVNHFGMDREGKLAGLLEELNLPLASWFVDNPHLILHEYAHPGTENTVIFTYDAGNLNLMREKGFANTHYLPLATDPNRFKPGPGQGKHDWNSEISFVGNSMSSPVAKSLTDAGLPTQLRSEYGKIATEFGISGETNVASFLRDQAPTWYTAYLAMPTAEHRLAMESLITWEATRQYRLSCVKKLIPFNPLIVGDQGWHEQLPAQTNWRYLSGIDYYTELPHFYPASTINFNCTSRQMPGAVNQRVFDVPACGAFLLTDYREQIENLFDLESEVVTYQNPEEIPDLIKKYMRNSQLRKK